MPVQLLPPSDNPNAPFITGYPGIGPVTIAGRVRLINSSKKVRYVTSVIVELKGTIKTCFTLRGSGTYDDMRVALRKTKLVPSEFKPPPPADDPPSSSSRDEKSPAAFLGPNRTPYLDTPPPTPPSTARSISLDSGAASRRTNDPPPDLDDGDLSSFVTVQPGQFRDLAFFIIFNAAEARRLRPSIETILTQSSSASPTDHAYIRYTLHATAVFEAAPPLPAGWTPPTPVIAPPPPPPPQQTSRGPRVLGSISSSSGGRPSILGNLLTGDRDRDRARESQSSPSPITPSTPLPVTEETVEQLVITRYDIPQVRQVLMPQSELRWSSRQQSQNPVSSGSFRDHGVNYLVSIDKTVLSPLGKVTLRLRINQSPRKDIWVEKLRFLLDEVQTVKGTDPATRRETVQVDRTRTVLQWEVRAAEPGETIRPQEVRLELPPAAPNLPPHQRFDPTYVAQTLNASGKYGIIEIQHFIRVLITIVRLDIPDPTTPSTPIVMVPQHQRNSIGIHPIHEQHPGAPSNRTSIIEPWWNNANLGRHSTSNLQAAAAGGSHADGLGLMGSVLPQRTPSKRTSWINNLSFGAGNRQRSNPATSPPPIAITSPQSPVGIPYDSTPTPRESATLELKSPVTITGFDERKAAALSVEFPSILEDDEDEYDSDGSSVSARSNGSFGMRRARADSGASYGERRRMSMPPGVGNTLPRYAGPETPLALVEEREEGDAPPPPISPPPANPVPMISPPAPLVVGSAPASTARDVLDSDSPPPPI